MDGVAVLGLDVGGSSTRALLATTRGERIGSGTAAGGNPSAHGARVAAGRIAEAVGAALAGVDAATVRGCVVGLAGVSRYAADPATAEVFAHTWRRLGLTCPVRVVSDVAVAYAAGTARASGSTLVAGTGAIAAEVRDREPVRLHDGYGWLLGDDGSGFWIGREAVRATLAAIDGRAARTELADLVLARYFDGAAGLGSAGRTDPGAAHRADLGGAGRADLGGADRADLGGADRADLGGGGAGLGSAQRRLATSLVQEVTRRPSVALASLAPLVMRACANGDPAAEGIVRRAADLLVATLSRARPADSDAPIVLAGAILTASTPVQREVFARVTARWPRSGVSVARDGAAGAAWLAALPHVTGPAAAGDLHARLLA
ncbi:BadF/BadG/BcrA/BcrD ATPase family protein [Krasilnikovia cinnamomea]|uniref:BadF/BadG/BcrA/BcrD ATPase family protein n=1 Tax=Krasilnikovia cinnamomea TaxID=349313 RepID=A0A4Q7ZRG6_9ACTN|nr:BadF/BadG/BcrA/BcrD ATPase family protein [Krasilnikovia cinnamomea]RZU53737.1 BadF/BadG/BcrA/BcrD ATPase family protein [Krasilnikovia cinnamomea]